MPILAQSAAFSSQVFPIIQEGEYVPYTFLLNRVAELSGRDSANISVDEQTKLRGFIGRATKKIWEAEFWPELTIVEERSYRATWFSTFTYSSGDEVYHSSKYWTANAGTSAGEEPGVSSKWDELTITDPLIKTDDTHYYIPIGTIKRITSKNPELYNSFESYDFERFADGVRVVQARELGETLFVEHRPSAPYFTTKAFAAADMSAYPDGLWTYYANSAVTDYTDDYFGQHFDQVQPSTGSAVVAGDPALKYRIPRRFEDYIVSKATADLLLTDEKPGLAAVYNAKAAEAMDEEVNKLYFQEGQLPTIRVKGY